MNRRKIGQEQEELAAKYLEEKGYEILERNYRIRTGEIDLIARDVPKQQRIYQTARYYLHQKKWENMPCRFDVIGITGTQICHIRNAFGSI